MNIRKCVAAMLTVLAVISLTGCKVPGNVAYFQDNAEVVTIAQANPIKLQPKDKLTIVVKSKDAAVSNLFNSGIYTTRIGGSSQVTAPGTVAHEYSPTGSEGLTNYTVAPDGTIDFPVLGKIKVEGMTRSQLAAFIKGELMGRDLVKDPTVTVEFVNTGINVLGEVLHPGRFDMNVDELSILEGLALAGDMLITGERKNVRVLREVGGKINVYTLDLTDLTKAAQSPGFHLQQNDVVYVEPNDMRKRSTTVNGNNTLNASFWISVASLLTTVVTTLGVYIKK